MPSGRNDWYRLTSWTPADQEGFWARLRRSRGAGRRAQYLRIQALHLEQAGLVYPAGSLLEGALAEEPDGFESGEVHHQLATCREKQGRIAEAVDHLRRGMALHADRPGRGSGMWLTLGRIAVEHDLDNVYEEFLAIVDSLDRKGRLRPALVFPAQRYLFSAILAIINVRRGNLQEARRLVQQALNAAGESTSGLRYHPDVGVVTDKDTRIYGLVSQIARDG